MSERELTITKLRRCPEGWWTARVTVEGTTVDVDCRYGSWMAEVRAAPRAQKHVRKDLDPSVARRLQEKVRPIEARERKEVELNTRLEGARRLEEFRELKPSTRDLERRQAEIAEELQRELRGVTLERIYREAEYAWARPKTYV